MTFKGAAVRVEPREARSRSGTLSPKDAAGPTMPGVVTRNFGKGRVVYLAAGFDSAYYLYPYPYQRLMLKQAINHVAAGRAPMKVEVADVRAFVDISTGQGWG